ncbi:MAG: hypothetical protein EPO52_01470 [Herbiconiux sp.]|uniref:hypothetical protein n=1 Tax=Herbiconiux sp. TaxID=1871186 RepID=UPI00122A601F|nr:hypothetical protein [Herbiconiux sp.]TAJ49656.1 MAG: hypothetical protein EPO52_01470 [Herbiconiux sp.]
MAEQEGVQINAQWMLDPTVVPVFANQIFVQQGAPTSTGAANDVYLNLGHLNPPLFPSEITDEVRQQFEGTLLPVVPVARVVMSRERVVDLHAALGDYLAKTAEAETES